MPVPAFEDLEAEKQLLGCVLHDPTVIRLTDFLETQDFKDPGSQIIHKAMLNLASQSIPIDVLSVRSQLKPHELEAMGGLSGMMDLMDGVPSASNAKWYAERIKECSTRRNLLSVSESLVRIAKSEEDIHEAIKLAEHSVFGLRGGQSNGALVQAGDVALDVYRTAEARSERGGGITGHSTGLRKLDDLTDGFTPTDLSILAARPSMGKSAFAGFLLLQLAQRGLTVLMVSLEMGRQQCVLRMLSQLSGVGATSIKRGTLDSSQWTQLASASSKLSKLKIWVDDGPDQTVASVAASTRRVLLQEGQIDCVAVDYMQLMSGKGESREQEVAGISRGLKKMAKEYNVPVLGLSQLNRSLESRDDKRPRLSDLRESGGIEQDADNVWFLFRPGYYDLDADQKEINVIQAKSRNGVIGDIWLEFEADSLRYSEKT